MDDRRTPPRPRFSVHLRSGFWKAVQLALAVVFLLMGVYGGDVPLGALCASIVVGAMGRPTATGHHRATAGAAPVRDSDEDVARPG